MKKIIYLLFISLIFAFIGCSHKGENEQIHRGMYWWGGNISGYESNFTDHLEWLKQNKVEKIYYKLFDVDWNQLEGIYPADGPFEGPNNSILKVYHEFIPCVFITNQVFEHAKNAELNILAERIADKIDTNYKEYQIDCDWSIKTKTSYFEFLQILKSKLPKHKLSVTIRLFQYKYPEKTGIPPADKGALMLYNFNSPKKYSEHNSIFNKEEAEKYITSKVYPLKLDFILPSFSWSVLYDNKEFLGLMQNTNREDIEQFCTKKTNNIFICNVDTVVENFYLRRGNEIKIEDINAENIEDAHEFISKLVNSKEYTISVFSLTSNTTKLINNEVSKTIFASSK